MDDSTVCPESTLESAKIRNSVRKPNVRESSGSSHNLRCESTIESANRRGFIKKAALVAAGAGLGASAISRGVFPESSASSNAFDVTTAGCNVLGTLAVWSNNTALTCTERSRAIIATSVAGKIDCSVAAALCIENTAGCTCNPIGLLSTGGSVLVGSIPAPGAPTGILGVSQGGYGVFGASKTNIGVRGCGGHYGVEGETGAGAGSAGVAGFACKGGSNITAGVFGQSNSTAGAGVSGHNSSTSGNTIGVLGSVVSPCGVGVKGCSECLPGTAVFGCARQGIGVLGSVRCKAGTPLVARGAACQVSNLQAWENNSKTALSVVNSSGWLGIGRPCAPTTLAVCGSLSARVATPSGTYMMSKSDFAVLATGNVTLPSANIKGMIVFVKNISTSSIEVSASGSDHIEGKTSETLSKQYKSLTLLSDGNSPGNWYILSNAT
jgi:hypothetical protein